jgi:23S rRNA pseudouridine1911/1915/1917 synthase
VLLDEQPADAHNVLRPGCVLNWQRPPWKEPDAPKSYSILHEDKDLIAVNKPAGLPTLPGANFLQSTLLYLVQAYAPDATLSIDWVDGLLA